MSLFAWLRRLFSRHREPEKFITLPMYPGVTFKLDDGSAATDDGVEATFEFTIPPVPTPPPPPPPRLVGRQALKMPTGVDVYGRRQKWAPTADDAHSAAWADLHRFPKGTTSRQRDPRATCVGEEPPLSLVCPGCELEQPPLTGSRNCPYCGLRFKLHGLRVFWWRDAVDVPEWKP